LQGGGYRVYHQLHQVERTQRQCSLDDKQDEVSECPSRRALPHQPHCATEVQQPLELVFESQICLLMAANINRVIFLWNEKLKLFLCRLLRVRKATCQPGHRLFVLIGNRHSESPADSSDSSGQPKQCWSARSAAKPHPPGQPPHPPFEGDGASPAKDFDCLAHKGAALKRSLPGPLRIAGQEVCKPLYANDAMQDVVPRRGLCQHNIAKRHRTAGRL